jgi:prolyl 4-hydroxylase
LKKPFNLNQTLQLAQQGEQDAQLALCRYYFFKKDNQQLQQWFVPLLQAQYPPALLCKVDFMMQQNQDQGYAFLMELTQHKVPGANYTMAMLVYFHPEISLDFSDFLTVACEQGEPNAIIAAASLFYQLGLDVQAARLLSQHQNHKIIAQLIQDCAVELDDGVVDLSLLTRPVEPDYQPNMIAPEINLYTLDHFLSHFDCQWLVLRAKDNLKPAYVVDGDSGKQIRSEVRDCQYAQLLPDYDDWILLDFERRIAQLTGTHQTCGEMSNILWYQKNEQYKTHYDFFHPKDPGREVAMQDGGQRVRTVLCYLNTPSQGSQGGATAFPRLEKSVNGQQGMLVVFDNTDAQGNPLPLSLHQGVAVEAGEKWLFSKWYRQTRTTYTEELVKLHL